MAIDTASTALGCDLPINFDTYRGCSHACKYCFVKRKIDISDVRKISIHGSLESWCKGHRTERTKWADWNIPLRWGVNSDPFQPCEAQHKESLKCLEIFKKYQYPFVVSTKGKLCVEPEYFNLLKDCKCLMQLSMCCSKYDKIETGCSPFEERITWIKKFTDVGKRVVVRCQPYIIECLHDLLNNIPRFAEYGAYAITLEGLRLPSMVKNFVKVGNNYKYGYDVILPHFERIRNACHKNGLAFLSTESDILPPDSFECCGTENLDGFKTNKFNLGRLQNGCCGQPSNAQKQKGTAMAFKACMQCSKASQFLRSISFEDFIKLKLKEQKG